MAARATVDAINSAESTISGDIGQAPIKLTAEVHTSKIFIQRMNEIQNLPKCCWG